MIKLWGSKPFVPLILAVIPLFYLINSIVYLSGIQQFYVNHFDPSYCYLMNGVSLARGVHYIGNIEHPGIPADAFAAIVIFIKHLFSSTPILYQDVLLHPESYLFTISFVLTALLVFMTFYTAIYVYKHTGSLLQALLFQVSPLFYAETLRRTLCLSAESVIVIVGIFFMAYLYIHTIWKREKEPLTLKNIAVIALLSAMLVTTKYYCVPIVVLVFFLLKTRNTIIQYFFMLILFCSLFACLVYPEIRMMLGTIKSMATHKGFYGQGKAGVVDIPVFLGNLYQMFQGHIVLWIMFTLAVLAMAVVWITKLRPPNTGSGYLLPVTGSFVCIVLFLGLFAKQYSLVFFDPVSLIITYVNKYYYFITLFTCFPLFIMIIYKPLSSIIKWEAYLKYKQKIQVVMLSGFIIASGVLTTKATDSKNTQKISVEKTSTILEQFKDTPLIIGTDGRDNACPQLALFLGISYSGNFNIPYYTNFLETIYPETFTYTTYLDHLEFWGKKTNLDAVLQKNGKAIVYLPGFNTFTEANILNRICAGSNELGKEHVKKIYTSNNGYENIYIISL